MREGFLMHAVQARYEILRSCLAELQRVGVLGSSAPAPPPYTTAMQTSVVCHDSPWPTVVHGSAATLLCSVAPCCADLLTAPSPVIREDCKHAVRPAPCISGTLPSVWAVADRLQVSRLASGMHGWGGRQV